MLPARTSPAAGTASGQIASGRDPAGKVHGTGAGRRNLGKLKNKVRAEFLVRTSAPEKKSK